ncbi:carboxymuconolactone decarboxylase family protein [Streptomyces sp. G5(2025)]|uniref:carboxymuconolactone decarboxylase family protein n=1 Tax=Streptomyces sp. G5(2025) TaxID=3406628 RepID=UPI003C21B933
MDDATATVRVRLIAEEEADGRLAELYDEVKKATALPFVPDMFRLASTRPDLLEVILSGYKGIFLDGVLPRQTRELIAAWTSKVNQCSYCVGTHSFFLQVFGGPEELAQAIATAESPEDLPVDDRTKVLLRLLTRLSREPYKITDADWHQAMESGWSSEDLLEGFFTTALFNFITRMVDGLGLGTSVAASRISQQEVPASGGDT